MDISGIIDYHARFRAQAPAVVFEDTKLDWAGFAARVNRLATALVDAGVGQGERVATVLANHLELLDIYWACAKIGAVAVPLSPLLMKDGLASLLADAAPRAVFVSPATATVAREACAQIGAGAPAVRVVVEGAAEGFTPYATFTAVPPRLCFDVRIDEDDPYNIMYTSGTTGLPKGIVLTHRVRALYGVL